jgi:hypothetical protein
LTRADERLDDNGRQKLLGLLDAGDPHGEVRTAWHAKETVRSVYDIDDDGRLAVGGGLAGVPPGSVCTLRLKCDPRKAVECRSGAERSTLHPTRDRHHHRDIARTGARVHRRHKPQVAGVTLENQLSAAAFERLLGIHGPRLLHAPTLRLAKIHVAIDHDLRVARHVIVPAARRLLPGWAALFGQSLCDDIADAFGTLGKQRISVELAQR